MFMVLIHIYVTGDNVTNGRIFILALLVVCICKTFCLIGKRGKHKNTILKMDNAKNVKKINVYNSY